MNLVARVEHACARFVEETFARVFPGDLDPAHVGRKLVAMLAATPGDLYLVRVHPADYARFAADRDFLEARWSALLREALPAAREGDPPRAILHEDPRVVAGSVAIEAVADAEDRPAMLVLERPDGTRFVAREGARIGRSSDNDLVLRDARVSRRHARIVAAGAALEIEDAGSANGTFLDGRRVARATLVPGSILTIGDTHLRVRGDGV